MDIPSHTVAGLMEDVNILKFLIDTGADDNAKNNFEGTPLHYAVEPTLKKQKMVSSLFCSTVAILSRK